MPHVWPDGVNADRVDADLTDAGAAIVPTASGDFDSLFDPLVVNPGRLSILLALLERTGTGGQTSRAGEADAGEMASGEMASGEAGPGEATAGGVEFVDLRRRTRLTDGNLACHARKLAAGGMIGVAKRFRAGKPVTTYCLTTAGRDALKAHVGDLVAAVRRGVGGHEVSAAIVEAVAVHPAEPDDLAAEDDWVD